MKGILVFFFKANYFLCSIQDLYSVNQLQLQLGKCYFIRDYSSVQVCIYIRMTQIFQMFLHTILLYS